MRLFPLTIRLDTSDIQVFERAAEPGEWAIPGSFAFTDTDPGTLEGKPLQAFRHGFLGLRSFGWSTLVEIGEIEDAEFEIIVNALALHFVARHGAPDAKTALPVAEAEAEFAAGLCEYEPGTLLAVAREFGADGIVERFKVIRPQAEDPSRPRVWSIVEGDDDG
jgi:hypothetical protein